MSIDYDRLRELVDTSESTDVPLINRIRATTDLENLAPDIARELLRLRDGVERSLDTAKRQIALTIKAAHVEENGPTCPALAALTDLTNTLAGLLNGDTE